MRTTKRRQLLIKMISNISTMMTMTMTMTVRRSLTSKKMWKKEYGFALRLSLTVSVASTSKYIYLGFLWRRLMRIDDGGGQGDTGHGRDSDGYTNIGRRRSGAP